MMISFRAKSLKNPPETIKDGTYDDFKFNRYDQTAYQVLNKKAYDLLKAARERFLATWKGKGDTAAFQDWENPSKRKDAIKRQAVRQAADRSARAWIRYRHERAKIHGSIYHPAAIEEQWGPQSLAYYKGMTRPESTLGLQLRTEFIGLNGYLNKCNVQRDVKVPGTNDVIKERIEAACTCGHPN
ncbi:hypothetical protein IL306_007208 [Fusarium sp. DS 682]|nr:hypothetical protein IL306_007208 [Fusarium sp. DS 682]